MPGPPLHGGETLLFRLQLSGGVDDSAACVPGGGVRGGGENMQRLFFYIDSRLDFSSLFHYIIEKVFPQFGCGRVSLQGGNLK